MGQYKVRAEFTVHTIQYMDVFVEADSEDAAISEVIDRDRNGGLDNETRYDCDDFYSSDIAADDRGDWKVEVMPNHG